MIFLDLYFIIKNPFFPRDRRKLIYLSTFFANIVLWALTFHIIDLIDHRKLNKHLRRFEITVPTTYDIITGVIMVVIVKKLMKGGTNRAFKRRVACEYLILLLLTTLDVTIRVWDYMWPSDDHLSNVILLIGW